jgi:putative endonuclease
MRHDYKYFVYLLNSSSRRVLYTGVTNALVARVLEHRRAENPKSFAATYRAFRLVYYEEYGDVRVAIAREKQIKGWTRAKKNALVASTNPKWRDLIAEWEEKFGLVFELDGRIVRAAEARAQQKATARSFGQNAASG